MEPFILGGEFTMRRYFKFLVIVLFGIVLSSCAGTGPTELEMLEILDSLETEVNETDLEGVMALFAEDALMEITHENRFFEGTQNIEFLWEEYFFTPVTGEFRDISVDGDTATFTWVEIRPGLTKFWPTKIEVQNGKITHLDWYEEPARESTGLE
jgi:hypothetical protein